MGTTTVTTTTITTTTTTTTSILIERTCPHCGETREYRNGQQFGHHVTHCGANPNHKNTVQKMAVSRTIPRLNFDLKCICCGTEYSSGMTQREYDHGRYRRCCSRTCASKVASGSVKGTKVVGCTVCGKEFEVKKRGSSKQVCVECGGTQRRHRIEKGFYKGYVIVEGKIVCRYCGMEECLIPKYCRSYRIKTCERILKKFGFDDRHVGSIDFYSEIDRITDILETEYRTMSFLELEEKYGVNNQTLHYVFSRLGIKKRGMSASIILSIESGRMPLKEYERYPYKSGHHVTWQGKKFWYRSSYEKEYCETLDREQVPYEMETLRIRYWDSQRSQERIAIPDFFLSESNEIVEIKSTWTYDEQNMRDRFKKYRELGYSCKLLLDKKTTFV